ncbi:MAG: aminoglycoside phosphotransferase family protein [Acetobacteraceae bacterium]
MRRRPCLGPRQVIKLYKAGRSHRLARHEANMTRAVFAAGAPAPEVLDEVILDGRFGIVLTRLDGPTLLQLRETGVMTPRQAGVTLAALAITVHRTPPPAKVLSLRVWMDHALPGAGSRIPQHIAAGILPLIDRLPPGDGLCHGDLHAGNVVMTAIGPRLVDWSGAMRAPAAFDFAVSHFLMTEIVPERADDPDAPRATNAAMQSEYTRLTGMSEAALKAALGRFLPVVYVLCLLGDMWPGRRDLLVQRIEAALRSEF